jgi:hypothetical protein
MVSEIKPVSELTSLFTYPNPAHRKVHVNLGARTENTGKIELFDLRGKMVLEEEIPPGYQIIQLNIAHLQKGIYLLRWRESGQVKGVSKVVKYR